MTGIAAFIRRWPVVTYYAVVFTVSWGGVLLVVGVPGGILGTPERFEELLPLVILALLAGPFAAGILMSGLVGGRAGLGDLLARLL